MVLEAGRIGWGASGRNGGQMIPGWRKGAAELVAATAQDKAKTLFDLALEARALTLERIAKHNIDCDLRANGHLTLAAKPADLGWMREEARDAGTRDGLSAHARARCGRSAREGRRAADFTAACWMSAAAICIR